MIDQGTDTSLNSSMWMRSLLRIAFFVVFLLLGLGLMIANAKTIMEQREFLRKLQPQRTVVEKLREKANRLEKLKALAIEAIESEERESDEIQSMLGDIQSADEIPIDKTHRVIAVSKDDWVSENDGSYSLFFSMHSKGHRFRARSYTTNEELMSFDVELNSNATYELRVRHYDHKDTGCQFSIQLIDGKGAVLDEIAFGSQSKYELSYFTKRNVYSVLAPYTITSRHSHKAVNDPSWLTMYPTLVRMQLDCTDENEKFHIFCDLLPSHQVMDVLSLVAEGASPRVKNVLAAYTFSESEYGDRFVKYFPPHRRE